MKVVYIENLSDELWWCNSHQRQATYLRINSFDCLTEHVCDPKLGGITLPCSIVRLTDLCILYDDNI